MTDALFSLTEDKLRKFAGDEAVDRAARQLLTGKVQDRMRWSDGDIEAYWDTRLDDIAMHAEGRDRTIAFDCTCGMLDDEAICEHVLAMLLAWTSDPSSFAYAEDDESYDTDETTQQVYGRRGGPAGGVTTEDDPRQEYLRLLHGLTVQELREIAHYRGIHLTGNRKEPILETLAESLSHFETLDEAWGTLSPEAHLVAGILPFAMGSQNSSNRSAVLKTAQKWGLRSEQDFQRALDDLKRAGLAFQSTPGTIAFPTWLPILLPADPEFIPAYLPAVGTGDRAPVGLVTHPAASPLGLVQTMTRLLLVLQAGDDRFQTSPAAVSHPLLQKYPYLQGWPYDLQELNALQKEKNPGQALWTRSFRIAAAPSPLADETRQSLSALLHIDGVLLDFAVRLFEAGGLLKIKEGHPLIVDGKKAGEWLKLTPLERAVSLLAAYADMDNWTEFDLVIGRRSDFAFRRSPRYSSAFSYNHVLALLAVSRRILMYQVRRQPAGRWADFEAFLERARRLPDVTGAFTSNVPWFFELKGRKLDLGKPDDWKSFYGLFAEALLGGPFAWLGLVELAYQDKRPVAYRLTEFGAAMLMQRITAHLPSLESASSALEYASDGSLLLHPEAASGELLELLTIMGKAQLTPDGAISYRLAAAGASGAFTAGWSHDRVVAVLQEAARAALPAELSVSLGKWWQDYGSLHFYEDIALMQLADDHILNELLAGTSLSRYLLYRFNPRLVAIRPEGVEPLREEMVKKGYTPKMPRMEDHAK